MSGTAEMINIYTVNFPIVDTYGTEVKCPLFGVVNYIEVCHKIERK